MNRRKWFIRHRLHPPKTANKKRIAYTSAELQWLSENRTLPIREYHRTFVKAFGRSDVFVDHLKALRTRKRWKTGRTGCFEKGSVPLNKGKQCAPGVGGRHLNAQKTQFKKGQLPANTKYLGHERVSKEGYVEISVAERNPHTGFERRYVLKHRWLWGQANGPVPEGMALKCLGDRLNTDPSNWEMVPRALLLRLNGVYGRGYDDAPAELKPMIMALAKLEHSVRQKAGKP